MKKIFNALAPTPKPCLKEETAQKKAFEAWWSNDSKLVKLKEDITASEEALKKIPTYIAKVKAEKEISWTKLSALLTEQAALEEDEKNTNIFTSPLEYNHINNQLKILHRRVGANNKLHNTYIKQLKWFNEDLEDETKIIKDKKIEEAICEAAAPSLLETKNTAEKALNACLYPSPLYIKLNLKTPCKEIKQKIKTVNRKLIYLDNKLKFLNHGILSLNVLNINKKLSDQIIQISKEFIIILDKLNPVSSEKLKSKKLNNITPNSSFDAIYKKAKDDLASYQTEGKILEAKLKILNLKEKTIPEKKIRLKAKISNLFKELKTCLIYTN